MDDVYPKFFSQLTLRDQTSQPTKSNENQNITNLTKFPQRMVLISEKN